MGKKKTSFTQTKALIINSQHFFFVVHYSINFQENKTKQKKWWLIEREREKEKNIQSTWNNLKLKNKKSVSRDNSKIQQ